MTPILKRLPEDLQREKMVSLIKKYVREDYVSLSLQELVEVQENINLESSILKCTLTATYEDYKRILPMKAEGNGLLNAFHNGMREKLESRYFFIEDLEMEDFSVDTLSSKKKRLFSDDMVAVTMLVRANGRKRIAFRGQSKSLISASLGCFLQMCEHFINTERAIKKSN